MAQTTHMSRVLLLLDHKTNRQLLAEALSTRHEVVAPREPESLEGVFDLCVLDGLALDRLWESVRSRKISEAPQFLPVLLVTTRQDVGLATRHLWRVIDDLIFSPIERVELQARVESLLHARRLSCEMERRVEERGFALRESEERLRMALDAARMGIYDWDLRENRILWSRGHEQLWGYESGGYDGTYEAFSRRVHPADLPGLVAEMSRCLVAREPFQREYRVVWPDGSVHWIMEQGEFRYDSHGQPSRMNGVVRETTARRLAEEQLAQYREQLRALLRRLEKLREEERTRIAREVHDVLGQLLTGLKMDMSWCERQLAKLPEHPTRRALEGKADAISQLADTMIETVQRISRELRPSLLDNLGLGAALEFEARQFQERTCIDAEVSISADFPLLNPEHATGMFRVFQELLTNVARHAQATQIKVRLASDGLVALLEVADNGRGISDEDLRAPASLGLLGMRERASLMGGQIEFSRGSNGGATVCLRVPVNRD
jgi:two-component system sensor histidine kinase UhpB